jgi:hypothetical protein
MDDLLRILLTAANDAPAPQLTPEEEAFVEKAAQITGEAVKEGLPIEVGIAFGYLVAELAVFIKDNYVLHGLGGA